MATVLAADGLCQTEARFALRTKAQFLKVVLPEGSEFWSATLDGKPTKPQRDRRSLLVSLAADGDRQTRELDIVYQTAVGALGLWSRRDLPAPQLTLHTGPGSAGTPVPVADLVWHLYLPAGYEAVRSEGTVVTDEVPTPTLAMAALPGRLLALGGGADFDRGLIGIMGSLAPSLSLGRRYSRMADVSESMGISARSTFYGSDSPAAESDGDAEGLRLRGGTEKAFTLDGGVTHGDLPVLRDGLAVKGDVDGDVGGGRMPEARTRLRGDGGDVTTGPAPDSRPSGRPSEAPEDESAAAALQPSDAPAPVIARPSTEPAEAPAPPRTPPPGKPERAARRWMLGARSLAITLEPTGEPIAFTNLGADPLLDVTVVERPRVDALALALALGILLAGLAQVNCSVGRKTAYVVLVALVATLVPVLSGKIELALLFNAPFNAACLLVAAYLVIGLARWIVRAARRRGAASATGAAAATAAIILAAATVLGGAAPAGAKEPPPPDSGKPYVIQIVEPAPPVAVPEDAVVVPYDPSSPDGPAKADRLLVAYDRFVALWNLAYPEKKIEAAKPPADYALAGAAFGATLAGEEFLLVEGYVEIDVFVDGYAEVPLALAGGVLARADLDGSPARMRVAEVIVRADGNAQQNQAGPQPAQQQRRNQQAQMEQQAPAARVPAPVLVVYVSGKGRHRLDLAVRLKLQRRGGWRVAEGMLPAAPATALVLRVLEAATEVRLSGVEDRRTYETAEAGQTIATAVSPGAALGIQWRPKVAEAQVDRGLTAESAARIDLREDQLRVAWTVDLSFRRGQREFFSLDLPEGYLVEKVEGTNVRGWQLRDPADGRQRLEVSLLKQAKDGERLTIVMWRPETFKAGAPAAIDLPVVEVPGAVRHGGLLIIHRSPLLDVRVLEARGAARTDVVGPGQAYVPDLEGGDSPLGVRLYQAYRFAAVPFTLRLEAVPVDVEAEAAVETVLKIAERERTLECRATVTARKRPLHMAQLLIPADLELDAVVAPGGFEWSVYSAEGAAGAEAEGRKLLVVYLAAGQAGDVSILLQGKLGETRPVAAVDVPRIEVLGVRRQRGEIVVQVDPAFDVHADPATLRHLETIPLSRTFGWLAAGQRRLAALALAYKEPDYAGRLVLTARTATVNCYTVTNVRVTDRALEETVLLDFTIENAGIREVAFRLPDCMREARVHVPGLRMQTVEEAPGGMVRVRLELQDQLLGRLRVLVASDRLLTDGSHEAPIPVVETGTTEHRYVALESAGRDEVVVEAAEQIDSLGRQQAEWRRVADLLKGGLTQAYLVRPGAAAPRLTFRTRQRKAVETAEARIGLARTLLVVDASGAYRGQVIYHVDNRAEQYLEVELPAGADLWTACLVMPGGQVEPVKPVMPPAKGAGGTVLIPLVKTEAGALDYQVVMKYAGTMGALGGLANKSFPLVRTVNINVELSQVELLLPPDYAWLDLDYAWLDFDGTMTRITEAGDLEAEVADYQGRQVKKLLEVASGANPFAQARAQANLKQLGSQITLFNEAVQSVEGVADNTVLLSNVDSNRRLLERAEQTLREQDEAGKRALYFSNAGNIWEAYQGQKVQRDRNILQDAGANWSEGAEVVQTAPKAGTVVVQDADGRFNTLWLDSNELRPSTVQKDVAGFTGRITKEKADDWGDKKRLDEVRRLGQRRQPAAPVVKGLPTKAPSRGEGKGKQADEREYREGGGDQFQLAQRYQSKLEKQQEAQVEAQVMELQLPESQRQAGYRATVAGTATFETEGRPAPEGEERSVAVQAGEQAPRLGEWGRAYGGYAHGRIGYGYMTWTGGGGAGVVPTGLASLIDVELPQRGTLYRFSTPRGDVRITARAVSVEFLGSLKRVIGVLIAIGVALWVRRLIVRGTFRGAAGDVLAIALIVLGGAGLMFGVLPIAGLVALAAGVIWKVALSVRRRRAAAQAAGAATAA